MKTDNNKQSSSTAGTSPTTILGTLSALLVPVVVLAAIGLVCGLMWNNVMPKLGWPLLSSLEVISLWYMYLLLVCTPFIVCVGIWKMLTPPVVPQIYITQVPDGGGVPSTEKIMANLSTTLRSVAPPPDNHPDLIDPNDEDKKENDKDDNDDFTIPTA